MWGFSHPDFLFLALGVPPLVWWWLRQRRPVSLRFPSAATLNSLPRGRTRLARFVGAGLRALGLLLLVAALAGPRWPDFRTRIMTEGIALMLLVDVSGSMAERDYDWNGDIVSRLDALKRVLGAFVAGGPATGGESFEGRPNDLMGLVTFATRPETSCPLTLSHSALLRMLDAEQPRRIPTEAETNIGDAIVWGLHRLDRAGARRKVLVLISDGEHNVPPPALKPRQAAQLAGNLNVPIYTIDTRGTEAATESDDAKQEAPEGPVGSKTLQAVATISGGRSFRAHDTKTLLSVYREIDRLERAETTSFQYRRYFHLFAWFSLASVICLVTVQALELTIWQRIP